MSNNLIIYVLTAVFLILILINVLTTVIMILIHVFATVFQNLNKKNRGAYCSSIFISPCCAS